MVWLNSESTESEPEGEGIKTSETFPFSGTIEPDQKILPTVSSAMMDTVVPGASFCKRYSSPGLKGMISSAILMFCLHFDIGVFHGTQNQVFHCYNQRDQVSSMLVENFDSVCPQSDLDFYESLSGLMPGSQIKGFSVDKGVQVLQSGCLYWPQYFGLDCSLVI